MAPHRPEWRAAGLGLLALSGCLAGHAQAQTETHLCARGENVIFACTTGEQLASVCATPDFSAKGGQLRFRYGRPGHPEIEWPTASGKPPAVSKGNLFYANRLGVYLRIRQDDNSVVVFSVPERDSGLVIAHGRKVGDKLLCRNTVLADLNALPVPVGEIIAVSGIVDR